MYIELVETWRDAIISSVTHHLNIIRLEQIWYYYSYLIVAVRTVYRLLTSWLPDDFHAKR
jgi:hypothetical protein